MKTVLLAIDLQFDFCNPLGSLYVKGADNDVKRIGQWICTNVLNIDSIIMSMDSHQPVHIAHQTYWKDREGKHPELFSTISQKEVQSGEWIAQYNKDIALDYLTKSEANGDMCTIWPLHCIIGTQGWNIEHEVFDAIERWTVNTGKPYQLVNKGMHQATEHYSIFKAAVEYADVESTLFNTHLIDQIGKFDKIVIVGEAADFCVANSLKDLLNKAPHLADRICMLTDCMSCIVENNKSSQAIFEKAEELGVKFCKSTDIF